MTQLITNPIEQVKPHASVDKPTYGFVSTEEILNTFRAKGWNATSTQIGKPRKADKIGFQKHLIRLDNTTLGEIDGLTGENASRVQLCLVNSHDGTGALRILWGVFRVACLNGLISGPTFREFKAVHSKNIMQRLAEGIEYMTDGMADVVNAVKKLQGSTFGADAQDAFVKSLVDARLSGIGRIISVNYASALYARRMQDAGTDAYTLANRVQEAIMRGGIEYVYERDVKDAQGNVTGTRVIHARTRRLQSVPAQIRLNRLVWDEALKHAA